MTSGLKTTIYERTSSCGCPIWLGSTLILIISIIIHIKLLLPHVYDFQVIQESFVNALDHGGNYILLPTYLVTITLDLCFTVIALWGVLRKVPLFLLTYILWSVLLMTIIAYAIYLVYDEHQSLNRMFYKTIVNAALGLEHRPSAFGFLEIMMCIPIIVKGYITAIIYNYYRIIVNFELQKRQSQVNMKEISTIIQEKVNEAVSNHMTKYNLQRAPSSVSIKIEDESSDSSKTRIV